MSPNAKSQAAGPELGLKAVDLTKRRRGRLVLDGVSLRVRPGERLGLLGPNGAGKTTCFGVLTGRIRPERGHVTLDGKSVDHLPTYRRARVGLCELTQAPSVFRGLTALQNIEAVLELRTRLSASDRRVRARELLETVGLGHLEKAKAMTLSGGERRRLELARVLVVRPGILLLDEPFAGVDPKTVEELSLLIERLTSDPGKPLGVVLSDHDARAVFTICRRTLLLIGGRVIVDGSPEEVMASPAAQRSYLGVSFRL